VGRQGVNNGRVRLKLRRELLRLIGGETAWRFWPAIALASLCANPVLAAHGVLSVRGNHQEGQAGAFAYSSDDIHYSASIEERIRLIQGLNARSGYLHTWETRDNQVGNVLSEFDKWVQRPNVSLSYSTSRFRTGWSWYGLRTEQKNQGVTFSRSDRFDNSLYANLDLGRGHLESRFQAGSSEREDAAGRQENTDRMWHTSIQFPLGDRDQLQYGYSRSNLHAITTGSKTIYDRHSMEYQGHRGFAGDKGRVSLTARSNFFRQETIQEFAGSWEYIEPDWTGFVLDDTPEFQDPLELNPVEAAGLRDHNLESATGINIGDSGQLVREFGGDYRNIIFDFGDSVEMVAADLYIDIPLVLPALMQWQVFGNDDPDGREWGMPLGADQVSVVYREWANGRQGWEFRFTDSISYRRLKLVNIKLGAMEPDIFLTELEVFRPVAAQKNGVESKSNRHRIGGSAAYQWNEDFSMKYGVSVDVRRFDSGGRNSTGLGQTAGFDWRTGGWIVAGHYQNSSRWRDSETDTDINSQALSVTPQKKGSFHTRFSAGRNRDKSYGRDLASYSLSSDTRWDVAPQLNFNQRVSYGYRQDGTNDLDSHSWALITRMRSSPRRRLRVDVTRRDRWVSQEAGYGFMTFNDTDGLIAWSVTNQIAASSRIRYQVRDEGEWVLRHFLSWAPLPGGNLEIRLFMNGFRDTRNESSQVGQGINVTWHPRSRLYLDAGYTVSKYRKGDEERSPQNLQFRGTWSF
jgi:hypothetical protein